MHSNQLHAVEVTLESAETHDLVTDRSSLWAVGVSVLLWMSAKSHVAFKAGDGGNRVV